MIFFFALKMVYFVFSLESPRIYLHVKDNRKDMPTVPSVLVLCLTLISSNYPCLEHIFIVPKVFEPLKFDCIDVDEIVSTFRCR